MKAKQENLKITGNCLEASFELAYNFKKKNFDKIPFPINLLIGKCGKVKIAHGIVNPDENLVVPHLHAWVEDDRFCYDTANGKDAFVPKAQYYKMGGIKPENVKFLTINEAMKYAIKTQLIDFWQWKGTKIYETELKEQLATDREFAEDYNKIKKSKSKVA